MSVESYVVPVSMDCHWHVLEKLCAKRGCYQGTPTGVYFLLSFFFFFFFLVMLDGSDVLEPAVVFTATKLFLNGIFQLFLCQMDYKNSISTLQVKAKFFWVILQA